MKTYSAKPNEVVHKWYLVDAENIILGRLASIVAKMLRGKHKTMYTPHIDCGDNIIVVNAEKVKLSGQKRTDKTYYWHTGYPGGIKDRTADQLLDGLHPERVIEKAVERMLPKSKLGRKQIGKLKVYSGPKHPHDAQSPEILNIGQLNPKNKRNN
ncbi:MAG: 50S ribosomal protein L13 [Pseudomonadota bacterium]|nr:50S ribosomal protein L13 [Pseudomonadota bacterium]